MDTQSTPRRQSLVSQTVAYLTAEIENGKWTDWLPNERVLSEMLLVSRNTLRKALAQMKMADIVRPVHGTGNQIAEGTVRGRLRFKSHDVAFLAPDPLELLRPTYALWVNELRALLNERGCRLHEFTGRQYFGANPASALKRLTAQHPHGCWVLLLSSKALQKWFSNSGLACVVAGTCHSGVNLTCVDLDHRAMCRHAAGVLLGLGHRRVAMLDGSGRRGGDIESEQGFREGFESSPHNEAKLLVAHHGPSVQSVGNLLGRLMEQQKRPTALLVANPYFYLTVASRLAQLGWRIPDDISVFSRDEDPFLLFLLPTPSRYTVPAHAFARSLLRPIIELLEGELVTRKAIRIMPDFIRGDSIAPPCPNV